MNIAFEKSDSGFPMRFFEKHVAIISTTQTVSTLVATASSAGSSRTFGGQSASVNSVMGITLGQQESMFAWLIQNQEKALGKATKEKMIEIAGIPNYGCVLAKNRQGTMVARGGGTLTLGFIRQTRSIVLINHFSGHNWDGSFVLASSVSLDATAKGALTK